MNISLIIDKFSKEKNGEDIIENTGNKSDTSDSTWQPVTHWMNQSEFISKYARKGTHILSDTVEMMYYGSTAKDCL